ncbi:MAG: hypothetical protein Ta2A_11810 [Treponemataceae bacterium]|nr:MAG: hypothetical protein Ta2A_11810 [Treponemataceae bacterium]
MDFSLEPLDFSLEPPEMPPGTAGLASGIVRR